VTDPFVSWLRERLQEDGPVTFAQFMEWALYHPKHGYYSTTPNIGPRGDFTTSPEASPLFGRLMAVHVANIDAMLGNPPVFNVIECGPGRGTLALDLLDSLRSENPDLYSRIGYWLVEISPGLTRLQHKRLLPVHSQVTKWRGSLEQLPEELQGALIANEVVDAFPVHVLESRAGQLVEHYVAAKDGGDLRLDYRPPSRPELIDFANKYGIQLEPGQRVEINLAMIDWMAQAARVLGSGVATIIDYGATAPARYSEGRKEGTLLGYYGGAVTDKVLAHPGKQDLTALVDFTALLDVANSAGFQTLALTNQATFLVGLGLGTTTRADEPGADLSTALANRRGLQTLVSPEGLGKFQVLVLSKGLDPGVARSVLLGLKHVTRN
jgi:SAM-dependent MidA family methyltransferase